MRVIFFTDTEWSLGRFYIELTKRLWQHDIDCHILSWAKSYNREEIQEHALKNYDMNRYIDQWVQLLKK